MGYHRIEDGINAEQKPKVCVGLTHWGRDKMATIS